MKTNRTYISDENLKFSSKHFVIFLLCLFVYWVSCIYWWPRRATRLYIKTWRTQRTRLSAKQCTESLCGCRTSCQSDRSSDSHKRRHNSSWHPSHVNEPSLIMWCHSSTSIKRPRWNTSSIQHRRRSLTFGLIQSSCVVCPHYAIGAWDSSSHMRKWATGMSATCLQTLPTIFFEPSGSADSHRTCKPFLPARRRAISTLPPISRTEFARLLPCLPKRASTLRIPTIRLGYKSGSRRSIVRLLHCRDPKYSRPHKRVRQLSH